jgi:alpha-galactosidase/6-phospho-beta-glucosidase family protein
MLEKIECMRSERKMKRTGAVVSEIKIAYIGGGSRQWACKLMADLALEESLAGWVDLYDIDWEAARENEILGNMLAQRPETRGQWRYRAVTTLKEALTGADLIIISIEPGTYQEMASDVHFPERYGIYQAVGDTVGPGGLIRALRTIPAYVEFAERIREFAPNAWVINYTNPMTLSVRILYEVFPEIKAFGCCHEVFGTQKLLAAMLVDQQVAAAVRREEIQTNVLGINHFTWINQAYYRGIDLFPLYRRFAEQYYATGFQIPGESDWQSSPFGFAHRVKFDLFLRYGLIAAAGDRHLVEFLPPWYLKDPETVADWKFHLTPVAHRVARFETWSKQRRRVIAGTEEFQLKSSGEEGVKQIKALVGLGDLVTNINLPNYGQIEGLPRGAVVETNAYLTNNFVRPVHAGALPPDVQSLVVRNVYNQETVLQAGMKKDAELAFRAFLNDPLMTLDPATAQKLFTEMLQNVKPYLPGWGL